MDALSRKDRTRPVDHAATFSPARVDPVGRGRDGPRLRQQRQSGTTKSASTTSATAPAGAPPTGEAPPSQEPGRGTTAALTTAPSPSTGRSRGRSEATSSSLRLPPNPDRSRQQRCRLSESPRSARRSNQQPGHATLPLPRTSGHVRGGNRPRSSSCSGSAAGRSSSADLVIGKATKRKRSTIAWPRVCLLAHG